MRSATKLTHDPRVARFLFKESLGSEALTRRRFGMVRTMVDAMFRQIGTHAPAGVSNRFREVTATVLIGGLLEALVAWIHGEIDADLDQIVEEYVHLIVIIGDATRWQGRKLR